MQGYNAFLNMLGVPGKFEVIVYSAASTDLSQDNNQVFPSLTSCFLGLLSSHRKSSKPINFFHWQLLFKYKLAFSKQIPEQHLQCLILIHT